MKSHDLFGVILRTIGVMSLVYGLWMGTGVIAPEEGYGAEEYAASAIVLVTLGLLFLFGADIIVFLSYRRWPKDSDRESI
jgi:pilus assembly protein TadC